MLLVSDFDFLLTITVTSYFFAAGIFYLFLGLIGAFFSLHRRLRHRRRESGKFIDRFKEKVDSNEIQGKYRGPQRRSRARASSGGDIYEDESRRRPRQLRPPTTTSTSR